jgi:putative MATE family efflux protein
MPINSFTKPVLRVRKPGNTKTNNMTKGNPFKLILFFSLPIIAGNLFQQLYSMADTIIVGRLLGTNSLAAVGTTGPINFLVLGFIYGLTSGFAVITAQQFGAKNQDRLRQSVAVNVKLNAIAAIVFTLISVITTKPMLHLINTPASIFDDAAKYISIIYWGIGTTVLYNACACILRALGDSKTPLYFLIFSSILNIALDILFIMTFKMGVSGAAWATVFSQFTAGILCFIYIVKHFPLLHLHKKDFKQDTDFNWHHWKIGLPMAFQFSITAIGVVILQGALNIFGATIIAAFTAAQKLEGLLITAPPAIGVAMANYAGQNMGASRLDRIKKGTNAGAILAILFGVIAMITAYLFGPFLTALFVDTNNVQATFIVDKAMEYMRITAPFYIPLGLIFVYRNVLQGIGKTFMPLMAAVFELFARSAAAYILAANFGYIGVYWASPLAWLSASIPLFISYNIILHHIELS